MAIDLHIQVDEAQKRQLQRDMASVKNGWKRAIVRAVNKVGRGERTRIARAGREATGLKASVVNKSVLYRTANYARMAGRVTVRDRKIPVRLLQARQTAKGVTYRKPGGGRELIRSAFWATVRERYTGVFSRRTAKRLPIDEEIAGQFFDYLMPVIGNVAQIENDISARLGREIAVQADLILKRSRL